MSAINTLTRLTREIVDDLARQELLITFHDDMPNPARDLQVALEVIEGRDDEEAVVIRNTHLFEGGGGRAQMPLRPGQMGLKSCRHQIEAWLSPACEMLRVEADMRRRGIDPLAPPLVELSGHPVLRSVIQWADLPSGAYTVARSQRGGLVIPPNGFAWGRISMTGFTAGEGSDSLDVKMDLKSRRLYARKITIGEGRKFQLIDVTEDLMEITFRHHPLPETMLTAWRNVPLSSYVQHPALDACGSLPVAEASNGTDTFGNVVRLLVKGDAVKIAKPESDPSATS